MKSSQPAWSWWRKLLLGLILLALLLSLFLSWHSLVGGAMAGCGGGSSCDQVLSSRWSMIAGVLPVSGIAGGAYLAMLFSCFYIGSDTEQSLRRLAWNVLLLLGGAIAGSAIWFTILQKWIIGEFCIYCMTTHTTGLILSVLIIWRASKEHVVHQKAGKHKNSNPNQGDHSNVHQRLVSTSSLLTFIVIGMALSGIVAVSQYNFIPSASENNEEAALVIPEVDYQNVPLVGSPDAPYKVSLLFDYQCAHCQKIHFMLNEAVRQYEGKLAFVLCPTPLENCCNSYIPGNKSAFKNSCELAKIGLAVWRANSEAFPSFDNWMFTYESGNRWNPRSPKSTRAKAIELLGREKFNAALSDPWLEAYLQSCVHTFGQTIQNGKAAIPKMIYDSKWIIPEPYNADDLVSILQNSLRVPNK
jgi:uncharacterized membrane protein